MVPNRLLNWPVIFNDSKGGKIPERQINSSIENIRTGIFNEPVKITGGFMEPSGHGYKDFTSYAISSSNPQKIVEVPPGHYNIGIDYVIETPEQLARTWYSGVIESAGLEGSYGYRVRIKTDVTYNFEGKEYPVYTAYAHLDEIDSRIKPGTRVAQGESIGEMGGTGAGGATKYPEHIDLQTWIEIDGKKVNVSPNVLQKQLVDKTVKQFSEPVLDIIQQQLRIPPGTIQEFWKQWQDEIQKSELPSYARNADLDSGQTFPGSATYLMNRQGRVLQSLIEGSSNIRVASKAAEQTAPTQVVSQNSSKEPLQAWKLRELDPQIIASNPQSQVAISITAAQVARDWLQQHGKPSPDGRTLVATGNHYEASEDQQTRTLTLSRVQSGGERSPLLTLNRQTGELSLEQPFSQEDVNRLQSTQQLLAQAQLNMSQQLAQAPALEGR